MRKLSSSLLALIFMIITTTTLSAASYESLINEARQQLTSESFINALSAARDAVRANPNGYKGHYYVAMAYMGMGKYDDALSEANKAMSLSPANTKPAIDKLIQTIQTRSQSSGILQAADTAFIDGMYGKAAQLYRDAWNAGHNNPEAAIKASEIYINKLDDIVAAAKILRQVKHDNVDIESKTKASAMLTDIDKQLQSISEKNIRMAKQSNETEALKLLQIAEDAYPNNPIIYRLRAKIAASGNNEEVFIEAIKELSRRGLAEPKIISILPNIEQWGNKNTIREFMNDLMGEKKAALCFIPTVEDAVIINNLMWQDEPYTKAEKDVDGSLYRINLGKIGNWNYAEKYCSNLALAEFKDWRLPTVNELKWLYANRSKLKYHISRSFWTSSEPGFFSSDQAWSIDFDQGNSSPYVNKNANHFIRCVRNIKEESIK